MKLYWNLEMGWGGRCKPTVLLGEGGGNILEQCHVLSLFSFSGEYREATNHRCFMACLELEVHNRA